MDHQTIFYYYSVIVNSTLHNTYKLEFYKTQVQASERINKENITIVEKFRVPDDPEPI